MFLKQSLSRILFLTNITLFILAVCGLGILALIKAPNFYIDGAETNQVYPNEAKNIFSDESFFFRFPRFLDHKKEKAWWKKHKDFYHLSNTKNNKNQKSKDILKKTLIFYLSSIIYLLTGLALFPKNYNLPKYLCSLFLFCGACFFASAAPIIHRPTTLHPFAFKFFIYLIYLSATGTIFLTHLSIILPNLVTYRHKNKSYIKTLYIVTLLGTISYLLGITGFISILVIIFTSFLAGLTIPAYLSIKTKDYTFPKKNFLYIYLLAYSCITASLLCGLFKTDTKIWDHIALISLSIPLFFLLLTENIDLNLEKIKLEKRLKEERGKLRDEIHDEILNKISLILIYTESALKFLNKKDRITERKLYLIRQTSKALSENTRNMLWIIKNNDIEKFLSYLKAYTYHVLESVDIECKFTIHINTHNTTKKIPHTVQINIYKILREIISNIIKHSCATSAQISFGITNNQIILEVKDNGKGFHIDKLPKTKEKHLGISRIKERVENLDGTFMLDSAPNYGTSVRISIPLSQNTSIEV